jgi:ABC-type glycerol-3-phosphate transport system permease component
MQTFKTRENWMLDKLGFPTEPTFDAYGIFFKYFYVDVIKDGFPRKVYFEEAVLNTVLFAGGTSFLQFVVQFSTAYVVFKYAHFKSSGVIYAIIIVALNLPLQGGEAASLKLYHSLGLYDSMIGMWLLSAHPLSFQFLLYYAAFSTVPKELFDAAEVDGASRFRIMVKIAMPLVKGMVLLHFMGSFITAWNNYQTCLMFMPSYPTVGYALYKFNLASAPPEIAHSTVKLTGAVICALPVIVVFCFLGNKMMNGVSMAGGVKG